MFSKVKVTYFLAKVSAVVVLLVAASATARADVVTYYSGDLRTNGNVLDCGAGCTLGASNTDGDYAQWAAVTYNFTVTTATTIQAITYSYGGGTSLTGALVAPGGLEPYLSLFDGSGNFLTSSYGSSCPAGAGTIGGNCFDVGLDTGSTVAPGTYTIALSAFENMSYAENLGTPYMLADGFTGLGNLGDGESLAYGFDVILANEAPPATTPEPASGVLLVTGLLSAAIRFKNRNQSPRKETSL